MSIRRYLLAVLSACALSCAGAAHAAKEEPLQPMAGTHPAALAHGLEHAGETGQHRSKTAATRPPLRSMQTQRQTPALAPLAVCDINTFASSSGSALIEAVKAADISCLNTLYGLTGSQAFAVFQESKMITIANGLQAVVNPYPGNNSSKALQLITYMRAGYYVQWYNDDAVGPYGPALKNAVQAALDPFYASAATFTAINDANGEVLSEAVILIDSSTTNARYLWVVKRLLQDFNNSWLASWDMTAAANAGFTVLFRGHQNADFQALVLSDSSIVDQLDAFYPAQQHLLGTDDAYLVSNSQREMARFLRYSGALKDKARLKTKNRIAGTSMTGTTAPIWVGLADMADYYDGANCAYYSTCNFRTVLAATVLPITHSCSATLKMRAQQMLAAELSDSCTKLAAQETYFHQKLETNHTPVANDLNDDLEMVIFDSSTDYQTYAGVLFGIDTNNGGMYLEGNPANPSNQARFIAYEAEWLRPSFKIWNLEHEYVHYLDGRFDLYGDFAASLSVDSVWWGEGLAEYIALKNDNPNALNVARTQTLVPLSTIFRNNYSSGSTRVYSWGYLAVRFMFEQQLTEVRNALGYLRPGNFTGYRNWLNGLGSSRDAAFAAWIQTLSAPPPPQALSNNVPITINAAAGAETHYYIDVPSGASNLVIQSSGGSGDADMHVRFGAAASRTVYDYRPYLNGNNETVTVATPAAGRWYIMEHAYNAYSGMTLRASFVAPVNGTPLQSGVAVPINGALNSEQLFYIDVPAGTAQLRIESRNGSGDLDLYVKYGQEASRSNYDYRPYLNGNNETVTVNNPNAGRWYVLVHGYSAYSGAQLTATLASTGSGCPQPDRLENGCTMSNLSNSGGQLYKAVWIPNGVASLRIESFGGSGNADLYVARSFWPSPSNYQWRSINAGNDEVVLINTPQGGDWFYVTVKANSSFSGLSLRASW